MTRDASVLFTGGSGLLGAAMRARRPGLRYPPRGAFDVTRPSAMRNYVEALSLSCIVHAGAFTSPPRVDADPARAIEVNVAGTAHVAALCAARKLRLIYISTDYVFRGTRGPYAEDDPVYPVNWYAWSKLGGECAARLCPGSLIIRTSFGPDEFPYEKAFYDQLTSRVSVSVFADALSRLIDSDVSGVLHVGHYEGRSVLAFAREQGAAPEQVTRFDMPFAVPYDTTLDVDRWLELNEEGRV